MPTVVARFAGLLLIPLLLASLAMAMDAPDRAEFHYLHGFEASGDFQGTCDVAGFRFDTGTTSSITFEAETASMSIYRTWANSTVVGPDGFPQAEAFDQYEQTRIPVDVPNGTLSFEWGESAHLYLDRHHNEETLLMQAPLEGSKWLSGKVENLLNAGPGRYHSPREDSNAYLPSGIDGTSRWVATDQEAFHITGNAFFVFDHVTLSGEDFQIDMPPYRQFDRPVETPLAHTSSILHTYGALRVLGLDLQVDSGEGDLGCGTMELSGSGSATFRVATGEVQHGDELEPFEKVEFIADGAFTLVEEPRRVATQWGDQLRVEAVSEGHFNSGKDYQLLGTASGPPSLPAQLALFGVLGGLALALWRLWPLAFALFTRVTKEKALEHPLRETIHQAASIRPGMSLAELVRETGNSYSTIQHHARLLVKLEMVSLIRFKREVHVFPAGTSTSRARKIVCVRNEPVRHLLDLVGENRRHLREVRSRLQHDFQRGPSWATRVVGQAERAGLVVREKTENGVMLCAQKS